MRHKIFLLYCRQVNKAIALSFVLGSTLIMSNAQTVSNYIGTSYAGSGNYSNFSSVAIASVYLSNPTGLAFDSRGWLWISGEHNIHYSNGVNAFNRIGPQNAASLGGGFENGTSSFGKTNSPAGIALNADEDIIICDEFNHAIRKLAKYVNSTNAQELTTIAGAGQSASGSINGTLSEARFNLPYGIAIRANGDMFITEKGNHVIRKISGNTVSTFAGTAGQTGATNGVGSAARFNSPQGVFLEDDSILLVAEVGNQKIRKVNLDNGHVSDFIVSNELFLPRDIVKVGKTYFISDIYGIFKHEDGVTTLFAGNRDEPGNTNGTGASVRFGELADIVYSAVDTTLLVVEKEYNVIKKVTLPTDIFEYLSTEKPKLVDFKMYPNPSNGSIQLNWNANVEGTVDVMDFTGKKIYQTSISNLQNELTIHNLAKGVYIVSLETISGKINHKLFVY
jgi:streptogramin lyase